MNKKSLLTYLCGAGLALPGVLSAQIFSDSFDSAASAANWSGPLVSNSSSDYDLFWGYDFSASIPLSPSGSAFGLKVSVNNTSGVANTVNLFTQQSFSGDYTVKFDMYLNYAGGGTTEQALFGINHSGNNLLRNAGAYTSDGVWFGVTGDGGIGAGGSTTVDYAIWTGGSEATLHKVPDRFDHQHAFYADPETGLFRDRTNAGSAGKGWVSVELRYENGTITYLLDDTIVTSGFSDEGFTAGHALLGYMDQFNSLADPEGSAFVIYDNFQVIPEPSTYAMIFGLMAGAAILVHRRRKSRS